jgi:hypothetical protein
MHRALRNSSEIEMTGKSYYITTLGDWQRNAARFANSHFIALHPRAADPHSANEDGFVGAPHAVPGDLPWQGAAHPATPPLENCAESVQQSQGLAPGTIYRAPTEETSSPLRADTKILVLIEADEGVHLALEGEPAFEALPHPLAQKPISDAAQSALAPHGVAPGATTFDAAEVLARVHPLLRHRVF